MSAKTIYNCFCHSRLQVEHNTFDEDDEITLALRTKKENELEETAGLKECAKLNSLTEFDGFDLKEFVSADENLLVIEFPSE